MFPEYRLTIWFTLYLCAVVLTQLLGSKTMLWSVGGVNVLVGMSILFIPFTLSMGEVVYEIYGQARANAFVLAGMCATLFVSVLSALAVALPASAAFGSEQEAYRLTFGGSMRFAMTSLLSFFCLQVVDLWCFATLKQRCAHCPLWVRLVISAGIALLIDTLIFTLIDHMNVDVSVGQNVKIISAIFFPYVLVRWIVSWIGIPLAYVGCRFLKRSSYVD